MIRIKLWWQKKQFERNISQIQEGRKLVANLVTHTDKQVIAPAVQDVNNIEGQLRSLLLRSNGKATEQQKDLLVRLRRARARAEHWKKRRTFIDDLGIRMTDLSANASQVVVMQRVAYSLRSVGGDLSERISAAFECMETISEKMGDITANIRESATDMANSEASTFEEDDLDEELSKMMAEIQGRQQASSHVAGSGTGGGAASALAAATNLVELEQASAVAASSHNQTSDSLRKNTSFTVRPTPAATGLGIGLPAKRGKNLGASFASSPFGNAGIVSDEEIDLERELGSSHRSHDRVPLLDTV